jgi:hypothetical protein
MRPERGKGHLFWIVPKAQPDLHVPDQIVVAFVAELKLYGFCPTEPLRWSSDFLANACSAESGGKSAKVRRAGSKARSGSPNERAFSRLRKALSCSLEGHDRQVTTSAKEFDLHVKDNARLAFDQCSWRRTRRPTGPVRAGLEAWGAVGGLASEIDFVGHGAVQRHVRS